jgi:hypothetical protein
MNKYVRDLRTRLLALGARDVEIVLGKHVRVRFRDAWGALHTRVTSSTPSDVRSTLNFIAGCRRALRGAVPAQGGK